MDDSQHITSDHSVFCIYGTRFRISRPFRSPQLKRHHAVFISRRGTDADAQDDNSASHCIQYDLRSVTSSWYHIQRKMFATIVGWLRHQYNINWLSKYICQSKQRPSPMSNLCQPDSVNGQNWGYLWLDYTMKYEVYKACDEGQIVHI